MASTTSSVLLRAKYLFSKLGAEVWQGFAAQHHGLHLRPLNRTDLRLRRIPCPYRLGRDRLRSQVLPVC